MIKVRWEGREKLLKIFDQGRAQLIVNEVLEQAATLVVSYLEDELTNIPERVKTRQTGDEFTYEVDYGEVTLRLIWSPGKTSQVEVDLANQQNQQLWNNALQQAQPELQNLFNEIPRRLVG